MFLTYYALLQFHMIKGYYLYQYLYQKGFDQVCLFSQFFYLKITTTTSYIQLLQDNIQDWKQVQIFFQNCSLFKFLLRSTKDKIWFISSFNTEVSIRIHHRWSYCLENKEEIKFSALFPANDDSPVSKKL